MDESLRSHRVDDLNEKRRRIKVLERDIERLGSDKDAYDEQRDDVEEEIDRLEEQIREVEEETRQHALLSTTQNGRINVAHARKKRRLDAELERLLEALEQKRNTIHELEDQGAEKARVRDEREAEMVTLEKDLVSILVEQQKVVLSFVEQGRAMGEGIKSLVTDTRLPWPPPEDPSMAYVTSLFDQGGPLHGKVAVPNLV
jgi:chromosome segregation ATPase